MLISEAFDHSQHQIKEKDLEESDLGSQRDGVPSDIDEPPLTIDQQSDDSDRFSAEDHTLQMAVAAEEDQVLVQVAKLVDGSSFGELALIEQKPRAATIRCLQSCHLMVLTKADYSRVIGKIEKRTYNEKINFLRNIPVFQLLTRTSLGKMTYYFEDIKTIKNAYLYREGDSTDNVYIVKRGEFQVTKRIIHTGPREEKIE